MRHTPKPDAAQAVNVKSPVDLLGQAIERVRPMLADANMPTKTRVRILWAAAKNSRDLASSDIVFDAFTNLAVEGGLIGSNDRWTGDDVRASVRPFGAQDLSHTIMWALRGQNPLEGQS